VLRIDLFPKPPHAILQLIQNYIHKTASSS
jgi:hypothetical protein